MRNLALLIGATAALWATVAVPSQAWRKAGGVQSAAATRSQLGRNSARPPNVIFILADDLGYGELGCYGQTLIRTPHLDQMAQDGIRFRQFYSAPICAPSRCLLMTGKHLGHAAIRDNPPRGRASHLTFPAETTTPAEVLKARGYATAALGKWGIGAPGNSGDPNRQGFDLFLGYYSQRLAHNHYPRTLMRNGLPVELPGNTGGLTGQTYSHDVFEAEALQFIDDHQDQPFFIYLAFPVPHMAMQVPEDSLQEYRGLWHDPPFRGDRNYPPHPAPRAAYAAMVTRMDRSVGRIRARLAELGLADQTLVMFTSDNGPTFGRVGGTDSAFFNSTAGLRGLKRDLYEGGIRVPFIASWPGHVPAGTVTDHPGALWDVLPTICSVVDAPVPAGVDGISFLPTLLQSGRQKLPRYLYWEAPAFGNQQAVRLVDVPGGKAWKAIARPQGHRGPRIELYNLTDDPRETRNVAAERPTLVAQVRKILKSARSAPIRPR